MHKTVGLVLLLVVLSFGYEIVSFDGNWANEPLFNITNQSSSGVDFVFSMHEMVIEEQDIDGVPMKSYGVPSVFLTDEGVPNLAGATRYVAIPQGAQVRVEILAARTELYQDVLVAPGPNIPVGNDDRPLRYG